MGTITKKICMLGDFGVGKTSLIRRFVEGSFSDQYLSTVGVKISRKNIDLLDPKSQTIQNIKLLVWDIEGQTKFKAVAPSYLQGAAGVLIVGDVTRTETIQHLMDHISLFHNINPQGEIVLALNKSDLVDPEIIQKLQSFLAAVPAQILGVYATSAKTGQNVDKMFESLSVKIANP